MKKVQVIINDSFEGMQIKKALETDEIQGKIENTFSIRWGNWTTEKSEGFALNSADAIKNTKDKENVILTLARNQIKCPRRIKPGRKTDFPIIGRKYEHKGGTDIKIIDSLNEYKRCDSDYFLQYHKIVEEYLIHVMDLNVFFMEEKYEKENIQPAEIVIRSKTFGWKLRETDLSTKNEEEKEKIMKLSKHAIYALGLDFGVVNIGKNIRGNYVVLDVDDTPKSMSEGCKRAYIEQFKKTLFNYDGLMKSHEDITIGADAECLIRDKNTGTIVFASEFFEREGSYGLDDRSIESGREYFPLAEIRPKYSLNPIEVVDSIESIIADIYKHIPYKNIGLYGGSMPVYNYWIGGHIHFGTKPNTKLIKALDNYLALPIMMIEKVQSARQRKKTYGVLANYREKDHGGFEYCSLSSWIVSPEITAEILCLAKVIIQEYFNLKEDFLCNYSDIRAFYLVNKSYFKNDIEKIIEDIKNTNTYQAYKTILDSLFQRISLCQEWHEEKDVREAWGLIPSKQIYSGPSKCFIPKKKRKELGVQLGHSIKIQVGEKAYEVLVMPKDDLTTEKEGYASLSHDICKEIGIKERDTINIWFDSENKVYRLGPILGIFAYREIHPAGPFALQSYYFRKLIKLSKNKGMLTYVFTIWGIDWENDIVEGYTYDFDMDEWKKQYFPIPQIIYDRGDIITEENYGQYGIDYLENIEKKKIKFINSLKCIELTNNKWKIYELLSSNENTLKYQPETIEYKKSGEIIESIEKYGDIFMKLKDGSRSKGIFSIEKLDDDYYTVYHKNVYGYNTSLKEKKQYLSQLIDKKIKASGNLRSDYIIQKSIKRAEYNGKTFEVRVVMQKNSKNTWHRTCMVARIVKNDEKFLDVWNEGDVRYSEVLKECFGDTLDGEKLAREISDRIRNISKEIVAIIDEKGIQAGEIAIDFAIDVNLDIYVFEINSKPDNLLARIGAFKMRNLACNRLLEYAKFLVLK